MICNSCGKSFEKIEEKCRHCTTVTGFSKINPNEMIFINRPNFLENISGIIKKTDSLDSGLINFSESGKKKEINKLFVPVAISVALIAILVSGYIFLLKPAVKDRENISERLLSDRTLDLREVKLLSDNIGKTTKGSPDRKTLDLNYDGVVSIVDYYMMRIKNVTIKKNFESEFRNIASAEYESNLGGIMIRMGSEISNVESKYDMIFDWNFDGKIDCEDLSLFTYSLDMQD